MTFLSFTPVQYIYVCTRMTVRKKQLFGASHYHRMLNMELNQIARFIGENGYEEIKELGGTLSGINLIEEALSRNLGQTYRNVLKITPSSLHHFMKMIHSKGDISNVLAIMRGKEFHIPPSQIQKVLMPEGTLSSARLNLLLSLRDNNEVISNLVDWEYYPLFAGKKFIPYQRGSFAELENALYRHNYKQSYALGKRNIRVWNYILPYIRYDIDIFNLKNLFRIKTGSRVEDIRPYIIPGGNLQPNAFQNVYSTHDNEIFMNFVKEAKINIIFSQLLKDLNCDPVICELDTSDNIWKRWYDRKMPLFLIMVGIDRLSMRHNDSLAQRYPFSALPIFSYLEHKRYEVMNLRAIARGRQFDQDPDDIKKYLVM